MIREKISQLLQNFDPDVRKVVENVIQAEYIRLETKSREVFTTTSAKSSNKRSNGMKLEYLKLNNFRQYHGEQTIHFACDSPRHVNNNSWYQRCGQDISVYCPQLVFIWRKQ